MRISLMWIGLLLPLWVKGADSDRDFALETSGSGTVYVQATLADHITRRFLVDTGSGMLTLNRQTFRALQQESAVEPAGFMAARLANGDLIKVKRYRVTSFRIGDDCDLGEVEVAVMDGDNNILGMNILLRAAPFTLHAHPPKLTLSGCQNSTLARLTN